MAPLCAHGDLTVRMTSLSQMHSTESCSTSESWHCSASQASARLPLFDITQPHQHHAVHKYWTNHFCITSRSFPQIFSSQLLMLICAFTVSVLISCKQHTHGGFDESCYRTEQCKICAVYQCDRTTRCQHCNGIKISMSPFDFIIGKKHQQQKNMCFMHRIF